MALVKGWLWRNGTHTHACRGDCCEAIEEAIVANLVVLHGLDDTTLKMVAASATEGKKLLKGNLKAIEHDGLANRSHHVVVAETIGSVGGNLFRKDCLPFPERI